MSGLEKLYVLEFGWTITTYVSAPFVKFIYSENATTFCEIFPLLLTTVHTVKRKGKISQNFVAFSEYMNFINYFSYSPHILRKPQMIEKNLPLFLN